MQWGELPREYWTSCGKERRLASSDVNEHVISTLCDLEKTCMNRAWVGGGAATDSYHTHPRPELSYQIEVVS